LSSTDILCATALDREPSTRGTLAKLMRRASMSGSEPIVLQNSVDGGGEA
jgi:hypothetical protein